MAADITGKEDKVTSLALPYSSEPGGRKAVTVLRELPLLRLPRKTTLKIGSHSGGEGCWPVLHALDKGLLTGYPDSRTEGTPAREKLIDVRRELAEHESWSTLAWGDKVPLAYLSFIHSFIYAHSKYLLRAQGPKLQVAGAQHTNSEVKLSGPEVERQSAQ